MMVVYHGDIDTDAVFDPAMLSAAFGQVKNINDWQVSGRRIYRDREILPRTKGQVESCFGKGDIEGLHKT